MERLAPVSEFEEMHMVLFEKKGPALAHLRIVSGAHPGDNPMRTARRIEQCLMPKMLHHIDATGGRRRRSTFRGMGRSASGRKPSVTLDLPYPANAPRSRPGTSISKPLAWIDQLCAGKRQLEEIHSRASQ